MSSWVSWVSRRADGWYGFNGTDQHDHIVSVGYCQHRRSHSLCWRVLRTSIEVAAFSIENSTKHHSYYPCMTVRKCWRPTVQGDSRSIISFIHSCIHLYMLHLFTLHSSFIPGLDRSRSVWCLLRSTWRRWMNSVLRMMNFAFKIMDFVFTMMDFASKMSWRRRIGPRRCERSASRGTRTNMTFLRVAVSIRRWPSGWWKAQRWWLPCWTVLLIMLCRCRPGALGGDHVTACVVSVELCFCYIYISISISS